MSYAINIYLKQITFSGGIPFEVTLPSEPKTLVNIKEDELETKIKKCINDILECKVISLEEASK